MTPNPRVSVIIPARNRVDYLQTSIPSILTQRFTDLELIVVDDGSTDATAALVERYGDEDSRVRLVTNDTSLGIPGARNRGIEAARGEYVAALDSDSDDYAYPGRLDRQIAFLDENRDYAVIGAWSSWMDAQGHMRSKLKRRPVDPADSAAMLIFNSCLAQPSVTARTEVLRAHPYNEAFDMSSDYELWARIAGRHKMASLPEVLVCCRDHDARTTQAKADRVTDRQRAIYRYQFDLLGMDYDETDVARHQLLPRSGKKEGTVELEYLDWAADWLQRLKAANIRTRHFEPQAFERVLGWGWAAVCLRVAGRQKHQAMRRFVTSPFFRPALAGIHRQAMLECKGGPFLARRVAARGRPGALPG